MKTIDEAPDAVKVACPVLVGGKAGDYIKGLPIDTIGETALYSVNRLYPLRGSGRRTEFCYAADISECDGSPGG